MSQKNLNFNISSTPRELIRSAYKWLSEGQRLAFATLVNIEGNAPYPVGAQMLVNEDGEYLGQITGGCAEQAIADQAVVAINSEQNTQERYGLDSPYFDIKLPCGSGIDVHFETQLSLSDLSSLSSSYLSRNGVEYAFGDFIKTYLPNPRLMVFGQGPILVKLAQLALQTGFDVCCIAQNDDTSKLLKYANLGYEKLLTATSVFYEDLDQYTAFISLFHEHELETELLNIALQSDSFYIGALGSRKTHDIRLKNLRDLGVDETSLERIHGPVGLNIGADTPAQIALSILAEVTAQMNQK